MLDNSAKEESIEKLCSARNVQLKNFSDAKTFSMPTSMLALMFKQMMKADRVSARVSLSYKGAEEIKRIYQAVVQSAHLLHIDIPNLKSMKDEVEKTEVYFS